MRALWRYFLAPLVMAAAVFSASAPAHFAASANAAARPATGCPSGTHWDTTLGTCIPN
jgi:hypothetical protein